jgi:hypothetical protein
MTDSSSSSPTAVPPLLAIALPAVLVVAMVVLLYVLMTSADAGKEAISRYIDGIVAGADVGAEGGDEAKQLTDVLRRRAALTVENFQVQAGTACFWMTVGGPNGHTEVQFLLSAPDEGEMSVVGVSAQRDCVCPDPDVDAVCHLKE